jgi:hypothetical protein
MPSNTNKFLVVVVIASVLAVLIGALYIEARVPLLR